MNHLYMETMYSQFNLLDPNVFTLHTGLSDLYISSEATRNKKTEHDSIIVDTGLSRAMLTLHHKTIDMKREHDLEYLCKIVKAGINVPEYWYVSGGLSKYMRFMNDSSEYLIKSFYQARTLGQMKVTLDKMTDVEVDSRTDIMEYEEFNKKYNIVIKKKFSQDEESILFKAIKHGNYYLSKIITFKNEFRVLYFLGSKSKKCIIKHRVNYGVLNNKKACNTEVSHKKANKLGLTENILKTLYDFGDSLPYPMLSFDVYVKEDGSFGLFEYGTQFGIYYSSKTIDKIKKDMTKAILLSIEQLK